MRALLTPSAEARREREASTEPPVPAGPRQ